MVVQNCPLRSDFLYSSFYIATRLGLPFQSNIIARKISLSNYSKDSCKLEELKTATSFTLKFFFYLLTPYDYFLLSTFSRICDSNTYVLFSQKSRVSLKLNWRDKPCLGAYCKLGRHQISKGFKLMLTTFFCYHRFRFGPFQLCLGR